MKFTPTLAWLLAGLFCVSGLLVACVDMRDHWTVSPTPAPGGVDLAVPAEPETINEAWRSVEDFRTSANVYIERRNEDIIKEEQKVATIEGIAHGALSVVGGEIARWGGPASSLALLGIGYLTKRRNDKTPEEYRKAKEESYNEGLKQGKALAEAALQTKAEIPES